eukprot:CAMPEP_0117690520 /NCGR_PEP_ID=MMETSP0804-20121206/25171_1 /TAXON_ID=1074897 /ORGANISM="Tetraselmis astigmatica, Strain CCMP880" /LENGTH=53 /DNA_ID=CAMNT_0005503573 /DNA_START=672 /DNA_END=833 /DNA_ORIENTATION=+
MPPINLPRGGPVSLSRVAGPQVIALPATASPELLLSQVQQWPMCEGARPRERP